MNAVPGDAPTGEAARPRPTLRGLGVAGLYGLSVAAIGLIIGRGNPFVALLVMIAIGVLLRLWAYLRVRSRGPDGPPWWKWL